jgi:chemotaxis protein methyltransferase CheR
VDHGSEFNLTDSDFDFIRKLVFDNTGIVLSDAKRNMVYSRLAKRLRSLSIADFSTYCSLIKDDGGDEYVHFVNAITTNLTSFFREPHHFDHLANHLIPYWQKTRHIEKRIRIWSAGCSTGEEAYSIAITLFEHFHDIKHWDIKILATDLDTNVVAKAKAGIYTRDRIDGLSGSLVKKWFKRGRGEQDGMIRVDPALQELITFKQLNLLESWPFSGGFDVIFCRNVVIYFNKDTQRELADRYANILQDDATLFLGHAESLFKVSERFKSLGNTIYGKVR